MPNITIYIQQETAERLAKESNKGGLINQLLRGYYALDGELEPVGKALGDIWRECKKGHPYKGETCQQKQCQ